MRAIRRQILTPVIVAAAIFSAGSAVHLMTAQPAHASSVAGPICPAGTNWDDLLHACV